MEKKVNKNTYDISPIKRVTTKFLEVSRCSRANNDKKWAKKVCCTCKVAFLLIRPIVVFSAFSFPPPPSVARFYIYIYILFEQTINITESFALSPG